MATYIQPMAEKFNMQRAKKLRWQKAVTAMAAVVVFCTTYALIIPALTWERTLICEKTEHTHTEACYETVEIPAATKLSCGKEEHQHSDACLGEVRTLVCSQTECEAHQHDESCYTEETYLTCTDEDPEHIHDESCYAARTVLTCGKEETEGHTHGESCYVTEIGYICGLEEHAHDESCSTEVPAHTEEILVCGLEEHAHTDDCFDAPPAPEDEGYYCGHIAHVHDESCYFEEGGALKCTLEEHEHTKLCESNPNADRERERDWIASFDDAVLRSNWAKNTIAIAETQIGYKESTKNFIVTEDGKPMGYTRYGAWYGGEYGDWCAMFCSFCLHYAGVDTELMPVEESCHRWVEMLQDEEYDLYRPAEEYTPAPGDLVFFDWDEFDPEDEEAVAARSADHVGFVYEVIGATEEMPAMLRTIEGNSGNAVCVNEYKLTDTRILGYAELPENPNEEEPTTITAKASDGAEVVITGMLPEGAEATIEAVPLSENELIAYFGEAKAAAMRSFIAYDIKIMADGEEWQPDETVSVVVKKPDITVEEGESLGVAHVDSQTEAVSNVSAVMDESGEVSFEAEGFSVYIFYTFTVDFHFGEETFSINGRSEILLSELLEELRIGFDAADAVNVAFSDETLLAVKQVEGDWLLTSLKAFDTYETLTVEFADGEVLIIDVTDAQINTLDNFQDGQENTLTADVTANRMITITKNTTLDLNGHRITVADGVDPLFNVTGGMLTIRDSKAADAAVTETVLSTPTAGNVAGYGSEKLVKVSGGTKSSGTINYWGDGALANLFDGNSATKVGGSTTNGGTVTFEFTLSTSDPLIKYGLVAGADTGSYTSRAPKSWILKGYNGSRWVTLSEGDTRMTESGKEYKFALPGNAAYQKYSISFVTDSAFQMADIRLYTKAEETGLVYYVTETQVTNIDTGATTETLKKYHVTSGGMIVGSGDGRAVTLNGGTLNLNGGYICNFGVSAKDSLGGAIYAENATVNLDGAVIAANFAARGGAIYAGTGTTLNIKGGCIAGNDAKGPTSDTLGNYGGGGVYAISATVNMSGGYVTNNLCSLNKTPCHGGGAFMLKTSTLNLSGGYITANSAPGGGGIMTYRAGSYDQGGKIYMTGGFITANEAYSKEGGGVSIDGYGYMSLTGGHVTNNQCGAQINNFGDWGGGGIFVSDAQAVLYVENALVTENHAGGFGGGIAGCSTGRLNIAVGERCANFGNTSDGNHLSGAGNQKNEDHAYAADSPVFMDNGYQDYYCALSSVVSGGMLGGGTSLWTGSVDGEAVTSNSKDDVLTAASVMGLTANPSDADKRAASQAAKVFINGNESPTHGGGILVNGYLSIGPKEVESFCRLEFKATKTLKDTNGREQSLADKKFNFTIEDEFGKVVTTGTNSGTNIIFADRLAFTKAGTFTYYAYEEPSTVPGVVSDGARYKIEVTVRCDDEFLQVSDTERFTKHLYRFDNVKITKLDTSEVIYNKSPGNDEKHAVSLDPTGGRAFNNTQVDKIRVKVIKKWADSGSHGAVTVSLFRNGVKLTSSEYTQTLSSANNWTYTWRNLPTKSNTDEAYTYTVEEQTVSGYLPTYETAVSKDGTTVTQTTTITNTAVSKIPFTLSVKKVDEKDEKHVLPNAEFELRQQNGTPLHFTYNAGTGRYTYTTDTTKPVKLVTAGTGYIYLDKIPGGTYTLVETAAPVGYGTASPMEVTLDETTVGQILSVTVEDPEMKYELPETGGIGTNTIYTLGASLTAGALMYGCILRRKRERRAQ